MACFELCVSPVLTQNEDIWNFHSSLTLNKGKLTSYSGSLWYAIVLNASHFVILFGMRKNGQNEDIWNFHGSLTLNKGKLI